MNTQLKRRIVFALVMGVITTGLISFVLLAINIGFPSGFAMRWIRAWTIGYVTVIPFILLVGPRVQAQVERFVR